jgi:urease accessory protein
MIEGRALYRLMMWMSPAYPTGAFAYSQGLEWAVEAGTVRDGESLADWVRGILLYGSGRVDGALFAEAWRAGATEDDEALDAVTALGRAWRGTAETALESAAQGRAFAQVTAAAWGDARLARLACRQDGPIPLAIAAGLALTPEVPLDDALTAFFAAFAANLTSAGVRLVPLGQTEGQMVLAALEGPVAEAARAGAEADLETLGTAAPMADLGSMFHETQYSRMFRS